MRSRLLWVAFASLLSLSVALADDLIYIKGTAKPVKTTIKKESAQGIQASGKDVAADDVIDVEYELNPLSVRAGLYRKARDAEKDSLEKEAGRKGNIASAIQQYEETLTKMAPGQEAVRRNIEFRIASLKARQALELGGSADAAIQKLSAFKDKHINGWQTPQALRMLASLYLSQKKFTEAEKTYQELKAAPVADEVKNEADFLAAQVNIQAGNHAQALQSLRSLAARLPKDDRFGMRARVAEAECLSAANKIDEANKLLHQLLKESSDKTMKAMAYNTLGKNLFQQGQFKEARWEFLWVDVVYNQDKQEHAKALYYLSQVFDKLGERDRAAECREVLLNDRQFAGSEYQRLAQAGKGS